MDTTLRSRGETHTAFASLKITSGETFTVTESKWERGRGYVQVPVTFVAESLSLSWEWRRGLPGAWELGRCSVSGHRLLKSGKPGERTTGKSFMAGTDALAKNTPDAIRALAEELRPRTELLEPVTT